MVWKPRYVLLLFVYLNIQCDAKFCDMEKLLYHLFSYWLFQ